jgi:hypothetical protein
VSAAGAVRRTRSAVEGATPTCAASWTSPVVCAVATTQPASWSGHVLAGITCGWLEQSLIGTPTADRSAHRLHRGLAALERGRALSDRHILVHDQLGDPKLDSSGQGSVSVVSEGFLLGEVNMEKAHFSAGALPCHPSQRRVAFPQPTCRLSTSNPPPSQGKVPDTPYRQVSGLSAPGIVRLWPT